MKNRILLITCCLLMVSFVCYIGYQSGYSHGERDGYSDGEEKAWHYYPKMSTDSIVIENDYITMTIRGITIVGEKGILDIISGNVTRLVNWEYFD